MNLESYINSFADKTIIYTCELTIKSVMIKLENDLQRLLLRCSYFPILPKGKIGINNKTLLDIFAYQICK